MDRFGNDRVGRLPLPIHPGSLFMLRDTRLDAVDRFKNAAHEPELKLATGVNGL